MNPLLLALPVGAFLLWKHDQDKRDQEGKNAQTPSGVDVSSLGVVPLSPGAEKYLPPISAPESIRNTYANAWAEQNAALVGVAAQQLRQLGYIDLASALENRARMLAPVPPATPTAPAPAAAGAACGAESCNGCPSSSACGAFGGGSWFRPRHNKRQLLMAKLKANPALARKLAKKLKHRRIITRMRREPAFALHLTKLIKARRARKALHPNLAQHFGRIRKRNPQRNKLAAKLARSPNLLRKFVLFKQQRAPRVRPSPSIRIDPRQFANLANFQRVRRRPRIRSALFR